MDFKKILEYNSVKNVHKRLMALNIVQKIILIGILLFWASLFVLDDIEGWLFVIAIFALYLFQSKK